MTNNGEFHRLIGEITARLDVLEVEVDRLREFRHNFPQTVIGEIQLQAYELRKLIENLTKQTTITTTTSNVTGENRTLTMRDVYVFCGGFTMFYAFAKLLKWIP